MLTCIKKVSATERCKEPALPGRNYCRQHDPIPRPRARKHAVKKAARKVMKRAAK